MWEINHNLYDLFSLPRNIYPAANGLIIPNVTLDLDGTTFRCYNSIQHDNNNLSLFKSETGVLTVKNIGTLPYIFSSSAANECVPMILKFDLDHRNLVFTRNMVEISWTPNNSDDANQGYCTSTNLIWSVRRTNCSYDSGYEEIISTNETRVSLEKSELSNTSLAIVGLCSDGSPRQVMIQTMEMDQSRKMSLYLT